jgi:hypothetical protein
MENLIQRLGNVKDRSDSHNLFLAIEGLYERLRTQTMGSAGLVIKAGTSPLVKAGSAVYASVKGKIVKIAANTDMAALSGTVTNAKFNVFVFTVDEAGTLYSQMGTEGASLAAVKWPELSIYRAVIGFVIINPTGTGNFVGGTTALDDATVAPNAAYVNTAGAFDPTAEVGI